MTIFCISEGQTTRDVTPQNEHTTPTVKHGMGCVMLWRGSTPSRSKKNILLQLDWKITFPK